MPNFDATFELKFAQLADSRLQEKVPALYPSRVGFQLIDKDENDTKGVGVMAFLFKGTWIYVPVFFLKGQIKMYGMYIKDKDIIVPLKDSWISFVQKGKVSEMGEGRERSQVRSKKPDMIHIMLSPTEKISNERDSLIDQETWEKMFRKLGEYTGSLVTDLPKLGKEAVEDFFYNLDQNEDFANAILKSYTPSDLRKIAEYLQEDIDAVKKDMAVKAIVCSKVNGNPVNEHRILLKAETNPVSRSDKKTDTPQTPGYAKKDYTKGNAEVDNVQVITDPESPEGEKLSDKEKEILMRDGMFVKDERENVTTVFSSDVKNMNFQNPTRSGLYEILLADGTAVPMLVLFPNIHVNKNDFNSGEACCSRRPLQVTSRGCDTDVFVVDLADPAKYRTNKARELLGTPCSRLPEGLYEKLVGKPEMDRKTYLENKGNTMLLVDMKHNCVQMNFPHNDNRARYLRSQDVVPVGYDNEVVKFTGKDGKLHLNKGVLFVPNSTMYFEKSYDRSPYILGSVNTLVYHLKKTAEVSDLKIYSDRNGFSISSPRQDKFSLTKLAALVSLMRTEGIHANLAKKMLKEASEKGGLVPKSVKYLVKYAANTTDVMELQSTPQPGEGRRNAQKAPLERENKLLPARALQAVTDASNQGAKEVLDTSVLASLASTSHSMELMGNYLSELMKAMDRIGRLLFLYYWHNDEFKSQYGNQEMGKLEESLRSVFDSVGDLVLFLKEKSVDFDSLFSGNREDMSEDLGASERVEVG